MTLLKFMQEYKVTKGDESRPTFRVKEVVVIVRPFLSPEPDGPKYEQYCKQKVMLHKPFHLENNLLENHLTFTEAFASFLSTGNVPLSLTDDVDRLEHQVSEQSEDNTSESDTTTTERDRNRRYVQQWMLLCQRLPDLGANSSNTHNEVNWLETGRHVPNLEESCTFITRQKESGFQSSSQSPSADPQLLQGNQLDADQAVQQHRLNRREMELRMIVSGTAGTGKSFLINCLTNLFGPHVKVSAPTGVATTKIHGGTLRLLLHIPTRGEFRDLEGDRLKALQTAFGDFGQLPPVFDLPLSTTVSRSLDSDLGRAAYQAFDKAVTLTQVMRQKWTGPRSGQVQRASVAAKRLSAVTGGLAAFDDTQRS